MGARNPAYLPTLLDDLSSHVDQEVRHSAARALAQYADDASVRAALEHALETDPCDCLRSIVEPVLQAE
jgi:HEAT repeat protein